jgi:sRNA-binding protein
VAMSNSSSDRKRGAQEARQAIELLRARWPNAFPTKSHEVRPLANVTAELQEALGWSNAYARGVLGAWKARESYCRAVLTYSRRIDLDGSLTEGVVDDNARAMARARLEQIAARKAKDAARAAARVSAQPPETEPTEPAPAPVEAAEPPRPRRLLVASSAAKEAMLKGAGGAMTTEVLTTIPRRAR